MAPVISSISPNQGPSAGGNTVTITGTGFTGVTAVRFGSASASYTVVSATQISATAPAGTGSVSVTVATPAGTSNAMAYTYVTAPVISSLSPNQGPGAGGNTVTITGTGFTGATAVLFGSASASFTVVSATQISATAPAGALAPVSVTVASVGGTSNGVFYYYVPQPTVFSVSPAVGPVAGGNAVTITGAALTLVTAVHFGSTAATGIVVVSDSEITAHAPAGAGTVAVTVTTPGGTSLPGVGSPFYSYLAVPVIASLTPGQGPDSGGTAVTITGTNLTLTHSATIGGVAASFVALSDAEVVATIPGGAPGPAVVIVTTPGGASNPASYELLGAPAV
ncbi:IPT/TIG domain-containing protein [Actinospica robiniae]|uniref:IPT/TIG domain-containing protein n=1 Tax=Actinospica robiniae TaxID=304901 RepID=UPI00040E3126|nr:IPT/TIG domain-containing protein [Actinospica robiniae]